MPQPPLKKAFSLYFLGLSRRPLTLCPVRVYLGDCACQHGRQVQVAGSVSLGVYIGINAIHLIRSQADRTGNNFNADPIVLAVKAEIHFFERQGEIKLVLALGQRVSVRRRGAGSNLFGNPKILGQLIDLGFVEVRDRLDVGGAVAELDKKPLVVFQTVRRAGHGIVQAIGVVVFKHLARALLEIRCGQNPKVSIERQAAFTRVPPGF